MRITTPARWKRRVPRAVFIVGVWRKPGRTVGLPHIRAARLQTRAVYPGRV